MYLYIYHTIISWSRRFRSYVTNELQSIPVVYSSTPPVPLLLSIAEGAPMCFSSFYPKEVQLGEYIYIFSHQFSSYDILALVCIWFHGCQNVTHLSQWLYLKKLRKVDWGPPQKKALPQELSCHYALPFLLLLSGFKVEAYWPFGQCFSSPIIKAVKLLTGLFS